MRPSPHPRMFEGRGAGHSNSKNQPNLKIHHNVIQKNESESWRLAGRNMNPEEGGGGSKGRLVQEHRREANPKRILRIRVHRPNRRATLRGAIAAEEQQKIWRVSWGTKVSFASKLQRSKFRFKQRSDDASLKHDERQVTRQTNCDFLYCHH